MRMLVIVAILCGLVYYSCQGLFSNKSPVSGAVATGASAFNLGKLVRVPQSDISLVPSSPAPARGVEALVPPDLMQKVSAKPSGAVVGADGEPVVPTEPPVSAYYAFKYREPPAAADIAVAKGDVQIVVDRSSRMINASGPKEAVSAVIGFCNAIDQLGGSCAVQTWAVYVDKSAQKGFDLVAALKAVGGTETTADLGDGSFTLNLGAGDVAVALSAICDGSSVEVVQRPHVRLSQGVTSRIESTQEIPLPMSVLSNGVSQGSIQFRKVGLQLEVTPYFLSNEMVRLAVNQTNGIVGDNVEIQGSEIPVIQSQTVQTTADLTVGQTVVLGGVVTKRVRRSKGLLRDSSEVTEGALYIVLSTYEDIPKARAVGAPVLEYPESLAPVPLAIKGQSGDDWIDGQLLPAKDWENQERKFIRSRAAK